MNTPVQTLKKRSEFLLLKAKGKRAFRAAFVMQWLAVPEACGVTIGYTASIKAIGNSVQRNRARRRLRAAVDVVVRLNPLVQGAPQGGIKLALIARDAVLVQPFDALVNDLRTAVAETGLVMGTGDA